MSALTIVLLIGAIICCGLCVYGITTAVRRAAERCDKGTYTPTRH
jgi:hypothetical protein